MDREHERRRVEQRLLGWTLHAPPLQAGPSVDIGRDLALVDHGAGLDLDVVRGADALLQDLAIAFTTGRGTDVLNATFGFDGLNAIADEHDHILQWERIRIAAIQLLRSDPRVVQVLEVELAPDEVDDGEDTVRSRVRTVRATVATVAGITVNVTIGRVGIDG